MKLDYLINEAKEEFGANPHKIQRVPAILRGNQVNIQCYYPNVSIGPRGYYDGMIPFNPTNQFKKSVLEHYASKGLRNNVSLEQAYEMVKEPLLLARNCYAEDLFSEHHAPDDDTFSRMLFVDGLFLVEFIYSEVSGSSTTMRMSKGYRDLVRRDILLMENQVPFKILQLFAGFMYDMTPDQSLWIIKRFLSQLIASPIRRRAHDKRFLEYFMFLSSFCGDCECADYDPLGLTAETQPLRGNTMAPIHLLNLLRMSHFASTDHHIVEGPEDIDVLAFPSATELKKVGIHCVACVTSDLLSDFCFRSYALSGELVLPLLTINEWTKPLFLNLLALCTSDEYDVRGTWPISSYLWIMHSLIDKPEDVKELGSRGILQNHLADDQAVVDLFREIALDVEPDLPPFMHVRRQISTYFKSRRLPLRVVFVEFKHRYFSSPWSVLVFLAIIFTVSLTIIQTILAGIQTYLTAHPPSKK